MEIELKYLIRDERTADDVWEGLKGRSDALTGSAEEKIMDAVYFDGADERLAKEKIAVRVRREGRELVATVKWGGNCALALDSAESALHARQELNVPAGSENWLKEPPTDLFGETEIGKRIEEIMDDAPLVPLLETRFLRRLIRIEGGGPERRMLCEAAVDTGEIAAGDRSVPICELELELLEGEAEALMELGRELKERYGLADGAESKFARGKRLRSEKTGG